MRIRRLIIKGLFDIFDHDIPFKTEDRVTIIHGPNGVGKTTILKLISDLFSRKFHTLRVCPYKMLIFEFEKPRSTLCVERIFPREAKRPIQLKFILQKNNKKLEYTTEPVREIRELRGHFPFHMIDEVIEPLERIGSSEWVDRTTGDILDIDDVLSTYGELLPFEIPRSFIHIKDWLSKLLDDLPTHFIQTQRLVAVGSITAFERHQKKPKSTATVERYSEDMVEKIQESLRQSAIVAASLDRTFPHRLLESEPPRNVTEQQIRKRYKEQALYRSRLMDAGLIDPEEPMALPPDELDKNSRRVLWHYLNDVQEKFKVFDKLLKRVELFKDIINSRFLYKNFTVNKKEGFLFKGKKTEAVVPLRTLSSGEQHELVLGYELLFKVKEGSLILIDEPELSLHVTWQHKFLEDITRISGLADLDFLVATHSPSIVYKQRHLMVRLGDH
jgi:energy-coupling factor transporter ATP-binding protein EcfA2